MALRTPSPVRTIKRIVGNRPFSKVPKGAGGEQLVAAPPTTPGTPRELVVVGAKGPANARGRIGDSPPAETKPQGVTFGKAGPARPTGAAPKAATAAAAAEAPVAPAPPVDILPALGSTDDTVRLVIHGREIIIAESYEVEIGVFTQPSQFALTFGHGGIVAELLRDLGPHQVFQLYVGDVLVQSGFIDTIRCGGEAAIVELAGRDFLQEIHDSYTQKEWTFRETDFIDFIEESFKQANLEKPKIRVTTSAERRLLALGKKLPPPAQAREQKKITKPVSMTLGERFYDHIKRVLDRGGVFLRAMPDGTYEIISPDGKQPPLYRAVHAPAGFSERGTVVDYSFTNSTVDRMAVYVVYARGGGRHKGVVKIRGGVEDPEMKAMGYERVRSFRDWHVQDNDQAELMARRRLAEARRRSWNLTITVSGHRTRLYDSNELGVWQPNTMMRFDSDQLGIHDNFYVENVRFTRSNSGTFTHLRLLRSEDLVFGLEDASS